MKGKLQRKGMSVPSRSAGRGERVLLPHKGLKGVLGRMQMCEVMRRGE
jgi:hypothetical protein